MNKKDASVTATLASLGLRDEVPLTPEQEEILAQATNPPSEQDNFLDSVKKLFSDSE